jgi:hypothetical protein
MHAPDKTKQVEHFLIPLMGKVKGLTLPLRPSVALFFQN